MMSKHNQMRLRFGGKGGRAVIKDDRTPEQKQTHVDGVIARDSFMSGWGRAKDGASWCAWACGPDVDIQRVKAWVRHRDEMHHVKIVNLNEYKPTYGTAHFHIYVCHPDHVAARYEP
jgi:hypothetical protein